MESVGGEINAYTSEEVTMIYSAFPKGNLTRAVDHKMLKNIELLTIFKQKCLPAKLAYTINLFVNSLFA